MNSNSRFLLQDMNALFRLMAIMLLASGAYAYAAQSPAMSTGSGRFAFDIISSFEGIINAIFHASAPLTPFEAGNAPAQAGVNATQNQSSVISLIRSLLAYYHITPSELYANGTSSSPNAPALTATTTVTTPPSTGNTVSSTASSSNSFLACSTYETLYVHDNVTCDGFTATLVSLGPLAGSSDNVTPVAQFNIYHGSTFANTIDLASGPASRGVVVGSNAVYVGLEYIYYYGPDGHVANTTYAVASVSVYPAAVPTRSKKTYHTCTAAEMLYVNDTIACGNFNVTLAGLGAPDANGISPASIEAFYSGVLSNESSMLPGASQDFRNGNSMITVAVQKTSDSIYSYEKYADILVTSPSAPSPSGAPSFSISAADPKDTYPRFWELFVDKYPGPYSGQGDVYANASYAEAISPGTFNAYGVNMSKPHTFYFVITQSGGSAYGQYDGNFTVNGKGYHFAGVNAYHYVKAAYSGSAVTDISVQACNESVTIFVRDNLTCGRFEVGLSSLGQAGSNGVSPAALSVRFNGVLTNATSVMPGNTAEFDVSGSRMYATVGSTFAGLYTYQKWANLTLSPNPPAFAAPVKNVTVAVLATDLSDPYPRYWELFFNRYPGAYSGQGSAYANASDYIAVQSSGGGISYEYPGSISGVTAIYLAITQSGGTSYGTYGGSMTVNGKTVGFSGLTAYKYLKVSLSNGIVTGTSLASVPSPTPPASPSLSVTASDPKDGYPRYWNIFMDRYPGAYSGQGNAYTNASSYSTVETSGATYSLYNVSISGTHTIYFAVTQSGGASLGTYSGEFYVNGSAWAFNGLDAYHYLKVQETNGHVTGASVVPSVAASVATETISVSTSPPAWMASNGTDFVTNVIVSGGDEVYPYNYNYSFLGSTGSRIWGSVDEQNDAQYDFVGWTYSGLGLTSGKTYTVSVAVKDGSGKFIASANQIFTIPPATSIFGPYFSGAATNLPGIYIGSLSYNSIDSGASTVLLNETGSIFGPYSQGQATNIAGLRVGNITYNATASVYLNETCSLSGTPC